MLTMNDDLEGALKAYLKLLDEESILKRMKYLKRHGIRYV